MVLAPPSIYAVSIAITKFTSSFSAASTSAVLIIKNSPMSSVPGKTTP